MVYDEERFYHSKLCFAGSVFAKPVRSCVSAFKQSFISATDNNTYIPCDALKLVGNGRDICIDSRVVVPQTGDFYVESDFVFFEVVPEYSVEPYWTIGGISPFSTPYGISVRGHVGWRDTIFASGGKDRFRFKPETNIRNAPYAVKYGIVDSQEYLEVNGVVKTNDLDGTERGIDGDTFIFFKSYPSYQNYTGTILCPAKLFSGSLGCVFDGYPCIRERDGVPGFYDNVNRRFLPSNGGIEPWFHE